MELSNYFPIWNKMEEKHRQKLLNAAVQREAKGGEVIHNGMADCVGILLIQTGQLRAYILSDEGKEVTIYRLFERDICVLSAWCIMNSIQFDINIQIEKDSKMWVIPPALFKEVMEESAPLANYMSEIMGTRLSEAMWLIEQIMWKSMDKRLAEFLLEETNIEGTNVLKITHEKIANHMGTAREVVTRMLKYFQNEGMVALERGSVEIINEDKLNDIIEK